MSNRDWFVEYDEAGWDELRFAGEMEARQLHALEVRFNKESIVTEVANINRVKHPKLGRQADREQMRTWLRNGWNTERFLRRTHEAFEHEALSAALQWAFPMAYYSVFAVTCGFFEAASFTENTHRGVIKKFGELAIRGDLPRSLSIAATGTKRSMEFHAIEKPQDGAPAIRFNPDDPQSVARQICQFLRSTRKRDLKSKASDMRFRTVKGKLKKRLNENEWARVANRLGATSILSLLYRKRIKANYRDIDTFADADVDAGQVHKSLLHIVSCLNFTCEAIIAGALGVEDYKEMVDGFLDEEERGFLENRLDAIEQILNPQ